jgi:hypothetical protein
VRWNATMWWKKWTHMWCVLGLFLNQSFELFDSQIATSSSLTRCFQLSDAVSSSCSAPQTRSRLLILLACPVVLYPPDSIVLRKRLSREMSNFLLCLSKNDNARTLAKGIAHAWWLWNKRAADFHIRSSRLKQRSGKRAIAYEFIQAISVHLSDSLWRSETKYDLFDRSWIAIYPWELSRRKSRTIENHVISGKTISSQKNSLGQHIKMLEMGNQKLYLVAAIGTPRR